MFTDKKKNEIEEHDYKLLMLLSYGSYVDQLHAHVPYHSSHPLCVYLSCSCSKAAGVTTLEC